MNPPMTPVTSESRPKWFHSQIIHQVLLWVGYLSPSQGPRTKDSSRRHMNQEILFKDCWKVRHDDMDTKTKHRKTHLSDTFVFLIYIIQFQRSTKTTTNVKCPSQTTPGTQDFPQGFFVLAKKKNMAPSEEQRWRLRIDFSQERSVEESGCWYR